MSQRRFDAIMLDFYGTVTSGDRQAVEDTCTRIVADLSLDITPPDLAIRWGEQFFAASDVRNHDNFATLFDIECETLEITLGTLGVTSVDVIPFVRLLEAYWSCPTLHPEVIEALTELPVPVCCVSNADTKDVRAAIELHQLRFDHVITSEDVRCYKPTAAIFERALEILGVRPDRVLHAGDSLHADVAGASALGITTVWVCREDRIHDVGQKVANHKILSLKELTKIVQNGGTLP
jgi:2-haloacid dehalogenase/putative hydrolase of the HAD superfamily